MSFQTTCAGCGLDVHDLPADALGTDVDELLDVFFERDDGGDLYCQGCAQGGLGAFL